MGLPTRTSLFKPFRALGYVTNGVPLSLQCRGSSFFITTCIGESFQIYNLEKMNLLFVGEHVGPIQAMASADDYTFVACESKIYKFKRAKLVGVLEPHLAMEGMLNKVESQLDSLVESQLDSLVDNNANNNVDKQLENNYSNVRGNMEYFQVSQMIVLGDLLMALCDDNVLRMWNWKSQEFYNVISFPVNFQASFMAHPNAYLNKIVVASRQGKMQLWNINTLRMIYEFKTCYSTSITFVAQSPVIDVVAIGLLDGQVMIHNIKLDKKIMSFEQQGKVTGISFRSDGQHLMATSNNSGDIVLWDLENHQLFYNMKNAHDAAINSISFLNGQPILLSAGLDNSVKQWIFDTIDGKPRLLKKRSGHHAPPSQIRYYGSDGHHLLSVGRDRSVRFFSTIRDAQNCELSQGSLEKKSKTIGVKVEELKLSQPLCIASNESKQKQWDNVMTCHYQSNEARTWNFQSKSIGSHVMPTSDNSNAKCVSVSFCGNFGFVGSSMGGIAMYNMQSGILRNTFIGHTKCVTGIATDNLNSILVSCSLDATVRIWSIKENGACVRTISLTAPASQLEAHHESGLVAFVCDDLCIRVMDLFTSNIVREFRGHRNRITDITFSPDGRWIVSSSMDSSIRTWDLPSGDCIDCFMTDTVPTSVTFSPTGDFLASSHVNQVGIFLWLVLNLFKLKQRANRAQYETVPLRKVDESRLFSTFKLGKSQSLDSSDSDDQMDHSIAQISTDIDSVDLQDELVTMSSMPTSKWQYLLHLDVIKKRNKPKEAPKQPEKAPFFLQFDELNTSQPQPQPTEQSDLHQFPSYTSEFTLLLRQQHDNEYHAFNYLKQLNPAAIDLEIRMIEAEDLIKFCKMLLKQTLTNQEFELVNVFLNLFIKIHADMLISNDDTEMSSILSELQKSLKETWVKVDSKLQYSLSLMEFIKKRR